MAVVVVGGSTRNIGKTSVVAALIARLPEFNWTAFKITQYGHGFCTADGKPCQCQTADSCVSVTAERDPSTGTDSARFLAAGAVRSLWVRTRIGMLADAMPRLRDELARAENAILESNSILDHLDPDLSLSVIDPAIPDFKASARRLLPRADAILIASRGAAATLPADIAAAIPLSTPRFDVSPPAYVTNEVANFARAYLSAPPALRQPLLR